MEICKIANCIDTEWDNGRLIEVGITEVDTVNLKIHKIHSIPIKSQERVSDEIHKLTGWTQNRLNKRGIEVVDTPKRLDKYGCKNRLLVIDHKDEIPELERFLGIKLSENIFNIATMDFLFRKEKRNVDLETMLRWYRWIAPDSNTWICDDKYYDIRFHRADMDSLAIAMVFIEQVHAMRKGI